jgi:hypothetical protein
MEESEKDNKNQQIKGKNEEDTDAVNKRTYYFILIFRFVHFLTFLLSLCIFFTQNSKKSIIFVKNREDFKVAHGFNF